MHNDLDIPNVEDEKFETLGDLNLSDLKKYEHILKSKQTQREIQYYETQRFMSACQNFNFIIQRTIAHSEIENNKEWILSRQNCYICERWQYTLFIVKY